MCARFGSTEGGVMHLDEVDCAGGEADIRECKFNPWGEHDCSAKEFAGVVCVDETQECGEVGIIYGAKPLNMQCEFF